MSEKTSMTRATLELTQKIQAHFPEFDPEVVKAWNGCQKEALVTRIVESFGKGPESLVVLKLEALLRLLGTVTIPTTTKKFVASDRFVINIGENAPIKISRLGDNFWNWFLSKIEKPIPGTTLGYYELRKASKDNLIIAELGGEAKAETTLAEMFTLMERQAKGEVGTLLTDGRVNIFYIKDVRGLLRAVNVGWDGDGWGVDAYSCDYPSEWFAGHRVISRNS